MSKPPEQDLTDGAEVIDHEGRKGVPNDVPRYEVLETSYLEHSLRHPGTMVAYEGLPGPNLRPMNAKADAQMKEYERTDKERKEKLESDYSGPTADDMAGAMLKAMKTFAAEQAKGK